MIIDVRSTRQKDIVYGIEIIDAQNMKLGIA